MDNKSQYYHFTFDQLDTIDKSLGEVEFRVHKAAILNDVVIANYLSHATLDRDQVACLEFTYESWKTLIELVSDILDDAEAAVATATAVLHKEWGQG